MTPDRKRLLAALPSRERTLELAGTLTPVLESGEGPAMVLLHGPGASAVHWLGVIPGLSETHRVIVPDLPGHGASQLDDAPLDAERVLRWLFELIEQTCESPPTLVGQLLGGAIAARFAIAHPDRLARLVLIDTFGLSNFQPAPEFARALTEFNTVPTEQSHQALWQHCARDLEALRRRLGVLWQPFEAYNIDRARSAAQQSALRELMTCFGVTAIPADDLQRLRVATTLLWGRHDLATPLSVAEAASARYGWPLHVIDDANDDPPVERPQAVLHQLRSLP